MIRSKYIFLLFGLLSLASCFKDSEVIEEDIIKPDPKVIVDESQLVVKVTNERGEDITGITAEFNNDIKVVDEASIFYFTGKKISKEDELLIVTDKEGESFQYKIYSIENEVNYHQVSIFKNYEKADVGSQSNQVINSSSGELFKLQGDNYLQGQNKYSGNVSLIYHGFDINNKNHRMAIPGGNTLLDNGIRKVINFSEVFRFDAYDIEKRVLNFVVPISVTLKNDVENNEVVLYYNRLLHDWQITDIKTNANNIDIGNSGIYAIASLNEVSIIKGNITINERIAKNQTLNIKYDEQYFTANSTNTGKWECMVPKQKDIKIEIQHECITSNEINIVSSEKINDIGLRNIETSEIKPISIKAIIKDCDANNISDAMVLIKSGNYNSHIFIPSSSFDISHYVCNSSDVEVSVIGNGIRSLPFKVFDDKINLDNLILCNAINESYLLLKDDSGNKIRYSDVSNNFSNKKIIINYSKSNESTLNLSFNHNNKEEIITPLKSNLIWTEAGFGNKGIVFNCPTSDDCGFTSFEITYLNTESEYIRGNFTGRFWIKTINPVTATYKNIEGEFQIRR